MATVVAAGNIRNNQMKYQMKYQVSISPVALRSNSSESSSSNSVHLLFFLSLYQISIEGSFCYCDVGDMQWQQ
jgi:hypothetical protein